MHACTVTLRGNTSRTTSPTLVGEANPLADLRVFFDLLSEKMSGILVRLPVATATLELTEILSQGDTHRSWGKQQQQGYQQIHGSASSLHITAYKGELHHGAFNREVSEIQSTTENHIHKHLYQSTAESREEEEKSKEKKSPSPTTPPDPSRYCEFGQFTSSPLDLNACISVVIVIVIVSTVSLSFHDVTWYPLPIYPYDPSICACLPGNIQAGTPKDRPSQLGTFHRGMHDPAGSALICIPPPSPPTLGLEFHCDYSPRSLTRGLLHAPGDGQLTLAPLALCALFGPARPPSPFKFTKRTKTRGAPAPIL